MDKNEKLQQEILERIVRIETKIDGYNNLREKLDNTTNRSKNNQEDIKEIKDNQKWLWRAFMGALIIAFVSAFITFGG